MGPELTPPEFLGEKEGGACPRDSWLPIKSMAENAKTNQKENVVPTGEIQPNAIKIDRLLARIAEGDIKIPAFQRGFVWSQNQIVELLDSLYRNYPVGSILLWSSTQPLKSSRNIGGLKLPDREPEYPVNYVLDGQQRLSTIYAAFCTEREFEEDAGTYAVNPEVFDLSFRFEDESFMPNASLEESQAAIPLACLFDTEAFFDVLEALSPDHQKAAKDLFSRFNNYELPVVTISKRSKDEVGLIFERINSTATTLTTLDLLIAWTWSEDFHLQEALNELKELLDAKGFGDLPDKIVLQCLGAILAESTKTKIILGLEPGAVQRRFEEIGGAIAKAVDFLSTEFMVQSLDFLPHLQQLVALTYFFHHVNSPTPSQLKGLSEWFWKTSFSRRYSGQTDDKMNADIELMKQLLENDFSRLWVYQAELDKQVILKQKFLKKNPYTRALLLLLAHKQPQDLTNGARVDVGEALSSYNRKEYHHIFPRAFLKKRGILGDRVNSLCNFCFLPSGSNKRISNKEPADYVFNIVPEDCRKRILESNLMTLRLEVYSNNDYDLFLESRAELIMQYFDSLII